jgi:branched-chain amino acid transport system permease protein
MSVASLLIQYMFIGFTNGSTYALVALGFVIIFCSTDVINFAQGEFVVLGGLIMVSLSTKAALSAPYAFFLTIIILAAIGGLFQKVTIRFKREASVLSPIIITIGFSIIFQGAAMFIWGKDSYSLPYFFGDRPMIFWGAAIHPQAIFVIFFSVIAMMIFYLFSRYTLLGKAMTACSENREAASLMGIDAKKIILLSFVLSAVLGAVAGIIITPITFIEYNRGLTFAIKGFAAAVLGGLGNTVGVIVAGFTLGIIESLAAGLLGSSFKDATSLVILLLVLFFKAMRRGDEI